MMEEVRNGQQTQDCTQWGLTALPPLGCDRRILIRAQRRKGSVSSYARGGGGAPKAARDAAHECPPGLALPVLRGSLSFNAADTGDVPAGQRVALSEAGTPQRRGDTHSPGGDPCATHGTGAVCRAQEPSVTHGTGTRPRRGTGAVCHRWHRSRVSPLAVRRLLSPGGSPGSPGRGPGCGSSGGR